MQNNARKKTNRSKSMRGKQGRKDSDSKRVNLDNERETKLENAIKKDLSNDPAWYALNPELMRSAASLPFSTTTGTIFSWINNGRKTAVPGVMTLNWLPSIGGYDCDAINAAKESIYSYVVHANSRNTRYSASDLMMVIIAGMQVFSALSAGIRAYGLMKMYDQRNRYLPKALVQALGFDFNDLQANLSQMWFDLNQLVASTTQIWIPNTMPVMDRWFWLNSNIYMDAESVKGQYYAYVQQRYLMFSETTSSEGSSLQWVGTQGAEASATNPAIEWTAETMHTWKEYVQMITAMIDALLDSEDRGIMMGDLIKAYGAERIYAVSPITADYTVFPTYNQEVLTQIENANSVGVYYDSIVQELSNNKIRAVWGEVASTESLAIVQDEGILNFHTLETPTPDMIMVATRMKALGQHLVAAESAPGLVGKVIPATTGTEYVYQFFTITYEVNVATGASAFVATPFFSNIPNDATEAGLTLPVETVFKWNAFDWAPWIYIAHQTTSKGQVPLDEYNPSYIRRAIGDYDFYTLISYEELKKQHDTAVYSEFGVPVL